MVDSCCPVWINVLIQGPFILTILKEGFYHPRGSHKLGEKPGVLLTGAKGIFPKTCLDWWTKGPPNLAHCQALRARLMTHDTTQEAGWGLSNKAHKQRGDCYPLLKFPSCIRIAYGPTVPFILLNLAQVLPSTGSLPSFMQRGYISLSLQFLWFMLLLKPMQHLH